MLEAELKAALSREQAAALPETLAALGFREQSAVQESDVYFNGPGRDFRETDEALRLRTVKLTSGAGEQSLITYKGQKLDGMSSTRRELETAVGSFGTMQNLLQALGYRAAHTVKKTRRSFICGAKTACLDDVEGLGPYLELETVLPEGADCGQAAAELLALLDALHISRGALTRESYLDLLLLSAGCADCVLTDRKARD